MYKGRIVTTPGPVSRVYYQSRGPYRAKDMACTSGEMGFMFSFLLLGCCTPRDRTGLVSCRLCTSARNIRITYRVFLKILERTFLRHGKFSYDMLLFPVLSTKNTFM